MDRERTFQGRILSTRPTRLQNSLFHAATAQAIWPRSGGKSTRIITLVSFAGLFAQIIQSPNFSL
ncbi:hypothetical protein [Novosphingobium sp. CF614]|uniref:hypothetical protein n=1 Tax=Novosphingobium sp. CF614 TaxID=1884364 RepID=UPI0011605906|nr:hypothetical protein [Novosphingobium sp. CF614]